MPTTRGSRSTVRALRASPSLAWESFSDEGLRRTNSATGGLLAKLGYTSKEWRSSAAFWLEIMPRVERTRVLTLIETTFDQPTIVAEFQWNGKSGVVISVEAHLRILRSKSTREIIGVRGIAFDITSRKETERLLRESIASRDHFLATLAHEMRTPISAIMGWAAWMLSQAPDPAGRSRSAISAIMRCAELQNRLVEDVVELSRGMFGKLRIAEDVVSIGSVLNSTIDTVRPKAASKRVELKLEIAEDLPGIIGDEMRLVQVLSNLVGNAVKFTSPGGRVSVSARRLTSHVEIEVCDTGRGLETGELARLFEPYYQVHATPRQSSGLGLGLYVAKSIIESHGGEIHVDSRGLNCGTRFTVRLPSLAGCHRAEYREALENVDSEVEEQEKSGTLAIGKRALSLSA